MSYQKKKVPVNVSLFILLQPLWRLIFFFPPFRPNLLKVIRHSLEIIKVWFTALRAEVNLYSNTTLTQKQLRTAGTLITKMHNVQNDLSKKTHKLQLPYQFFFFWQIHLELKKSGLQYILLS